MSLYGYKPKHAKAPYVGVRGLSQVRGPVHETKKYTNRRSKTRTRQMREYIPGMLEFLKANPICQRCGQQATCLHHWAGRRNAQLLVKKDWRASCSECNQFAKDDPKKAREEGWIAPEGVYKT